MTDKIQAFANLTAEQQPSAGGKGGTLARLYQAGYPVPDGFVILPLAFAEDELSSDGKSADVVPSDSRAGDQLSADTWHQIQAHLARLRRSDPEATFAVRSSALAEDSARASYAGEFETVLGVRTDRAVRAAIHTVRKSRHSERVQTYGQARGLAVDHEMAVVIQQLVPATISGVLFTADPVGGSRIKMMGNYVYGPGQELVSGEARPYSFTMTRPKGKYNGPHELRPFSRRLFKLAMRLEQELCGPQDIEWAIAGEKVYVLQSRPITTLVGFDPATGEFNDTLTGDYVWSCVNIGEAMSIVMTPFTWSIVRRAFDELNILPGYASAGNIGGRAYQNVTVMISVFRALGRKFDDLSQEMGGVREEYLETMDQYLSPLAEATFLKVLPNALRMQKKQRQGMKGLEDFVIDNPTWCQITRHRIQVATEGDELISLWVDEQMPRSLAWFWHTMATAWHYGESVGKLRRELQELVGSEDADNLLSNLSSQDELLASLGPVVGLARVSRGEMSRAAYLEEWGHRGSLETEASAPRPAEDPKWLDRQLATFARSPVDVEALLDAKHGKFDAAWQRFQEDHPRKAKSMRRRLGEAAETIRIREAIRSEGARLVWVARVWALRIGELCGIGDGVFFLTFEELLDLLAGSGTATAYIPARRQTYERYKALPSLPLIIRGRFDPFQWAADPDRRSDVFDSHGLLPKLTLKPPNENMVLGMPGSAGQASGPVRRLDSPGDGDQLETGEILVAAQTNIGWTLLFPRAAAIVTDVGAPLSHAAIVARELGIPAVVNCGDATTRLHTGDHVRVDGTQGVVEILDTTD